jgi:putative thioredoxin
MLERLAAEYGGKFKLVKINSDESLDLAREFNVRSIPDVRAIRNGKQVGAFVGALPLPQLRTFIDKLIPSASETERLRAGELRAAGKTAEAVASLEKALQLDPANDLVRIDLAELLLERKGADEAESLLTAVRPDVATDDRVAALRQGVAFARSTQSGPGVPELERQIASVPEDLDARLRLSNLYAGAQRYPEAMDHLLEIVRRNKAFKDGEARKQMVAIFGLAASDPDLVSAYRRKLASALY